MLVTFKSSAFADLTMFGEVAVSLLKHMGQSGDVPGAILAADLDDALENLQTSLSKIEPVADTGQNDDEEESTVSLATRANPLIKSLKAAASANADVLWEA